MSRIVGCCIGCATPPFYWLTRRNAKILAAAGAADVAISRAGASVGAGASTSAMDVDTDLKPTSGGQAKPLRAANPELVQQVGRRRLEKEPLGKRSILVCWT